MANYIRLFYRVDKRHPRWPLIQRCIRAAFLLVIGLVTPALAHSAQLDLELIETLTGIELEKATLCHNNEDIPNFSSTAQQLAERLHLEMNDSIDGAQGIAILNRLVYRDLGIRGSTDLGDVCNLLPSLVLARKQGYCVGIAAIYLALAERLDLPIFAVATPSHVFLRYDDGGTRINIETLQQGANIPDEQYIRENRIPEESIRRGVFMRNLSTDEFLAEVHSNLGVIYSERGDYPSAAVEYGRALDLAPRFPAAHYNLANDLLKQKQYRQAVRQFSRSLRLYPTDVWALNNRGLAWSKMGKADRSRRDFEAALRLDPGFEPARKNLEAGASPPR